MFKYRKILLQLVFCFNNTESCYNCNKFFSEGILTIK